MGRSLRKKRNAKKVTTKVKEKKVQKKHFNVKQIQDPELRKRFDKGKTLKENMEQTNLKEMYKDVLPKKIPKKGAHPVKVNEEEAPICKELLKKHGDDYEKMHWDIKVNVFQWTARQCEKKVKALKAGKVRSMKAEILSGHGMDWRRPLYGKPKDRNVFGH
ncbi:Nucleolar protein 16 [Durusdinium trenchii]|uniref:Nucleolar protein 16 n=1 Tax=Durusdinium trenchii TaxID=1381693 RepID=A0ABP0QB48_9DINO